ncbi:hypothetical protein BDZ97DRAFT_1928216 [Flammula alnicola]|nr:hypothetical protein BDZ97DRAFT_1928216 [Flammula alnicola]
MGTRDLTCQRITTLDCIPKTPSPTTVPKMNHAIRKTVLMISLRSKKAKHEDTSPPPVPTLVAPFEHATYKPQPVTQNTPPIPKELIARPSPWSTMDLTWWEQCVEEADTLRRGKAKEIAEAEVEEFR